MNWIDELKNLLGDCVRTDEATLQAHAGDKWHAAALPEAVVLATSTEAVSTAMKVAHAHGIRCNIFWSDDPAEAAEWLDWGMDVILTNDYQRMADALGDRVKTGFIGS